RVSHPEHGDGFVLAVGGAGYNGYKALTDEVAELSDGELIVSFGRRGKRRVNAAEVSTTNLCVPAIRTELSRKALAHGAWFELGASCRHREHYCDCGCVVLGSESLADNDGKLLIEFDDPSGEGHGQQLFVDPAELMLTRIWHPEHGPAIFCSRR